MLGSVASFHMQHEKIPKAICNDIEKAQRQFIWGGSSDQRKARLINWKTLCTPRLAGGLSFKSLVSMNEAFLLKLGWRILASLDSLWVKVMKGKYDRGQFQQFQCKCYPYDSKVWKDISSVWPILTSNIKFCLGNGEKIKFWKHTWLDEDTPLLDAALVPIDDEA